MAVYTLGKLLSDVLSDIGVLKRGRASGGSTTTIVESGRVDSAGDEVYTGGSAFILRDSAGLSAAPEGQFARITSYASGSGTFTLTDTLTAVVASGDRYGVVSLNYPIDDLIEFVNDALQQFDIPLINTSITSAEAQTEYDLPVALKERDLLRVRYQGRTDDSNDNKWHDIYDWKIVPASPGSVGILIIPQISSGRTVQLWYMGKHPTLNAYDDEIAEVINPRVARAAVKERIRNKEAEITLSASPQQRRSYDKAKAELEEAITKYPIFAPPQIGRLFIVDFPWL